MPTNGKDALEGKWPQRRPQKRLNRRLEEVAKAVGGGYYRLQTPLKLTFGLRQTVAGHRLGALERGGHTSAPSNTSLTNGVAGRTVQQVIAWFLASPLNDCATLGLSITNKNAMRKPS